MDTSTKYDRTVSKNVAKMEKRMMAQMELHTFNTFIPFSILGYLENFKLFCHTNKIREGADMSLFHLVVNKSASAVLVLNARLRVDSSK